MANILIIAEHSDGKIKKYSLELANKAKELADKLGGTANAILIGEGVKAAAGELGNYGVKKVIVVENPALKFYNADGYTKVICDIINSDKPSIVLGSATPMGKDLLPRVAARLKVGVAQDCIVLDIENGRLKARRPVFAGKALIDISFKSDPQVATARPNSFPLGDPSAAAAEIVVVNAEPGSMRANVKELKQFERGEIDVAEADVIVAGGRAMGSSENFKMIYDLAHVLGAAVGASRAAVDAGYISHDHQVGQTGKTVNPKLYVACGISGAIQHLAGMRTSKVIVAINRDPEAPIFSKADFGIVGDMFKIVPVLTEKLKKEMAE